MSLENILRIYAAVAGACFGIWQLFLGESKLDTHLFTAFFATGICLLVVPLGRDSWRSAPLDVDVFATVRWGMVGGAIVAGAIGLPAFNTALIKAPTDRFRLQLFIIMMIVQFAVPAVALIVVDLRQSKSLPLRTICGLIAGVVTVLLLSPEK